MLNIFFLYWIEIIEKFIYGIELTYYVLRTNAPTVFRTSYIINITFFINKF